MLYIKLALCGVVIALSCLLSGRAANLDKKNSETIRALAQCLMLFKNGLILQRKTVVEMIDGISDSDKGLAAFKSACLDELKRSAEEPLESILSESISAMGLSIRYREQVRAELKYIGGAIEQPSPALGADQLDIAYGRLLCLADAAKDRYTKNLRLYQRISVLCGAAVCLLVF